MTRRRPLATTPDPQYVGEEVQNTVSFLRLRTIFGGRYTIITIGSRKCEEVTFALELIRL